MTDDGAASTRLVLVRHGESACNVLQVIGGLTGCTGLTDLGVRQVEALRDRWKTSGELDGAAVLYASLLPRARQTADILAPALGHPEVTADCDLCELHPGVADGMSWTDFEATYRIPDWATEPDRDFSPGGESWSTFRARVEVALRALAERHPGQTVVVASHGGVISSSLYTFLGVPRRPPGLRLAPSYSGITEWEAAGGSFRLVRYNDAAHLASAGVPSGR
ncbi:MAG: histidine phosphatase family protein [Acidimicrobiales bacterium]|nr:histidine phosphatase family protein [Acidimicrobiales bacterium]